MRVIRSGQTTPTVVVNDATYLEVSLTGEFFGADDRHSGLPMLRDR